ncbi:23S rRNA (guanosine(2251)-2'-O)-methyltransferase RlmB [Clostridia bacterium]|nr:23S rRNA (guanosine(2251)-2'-O)-methyltransferase RlmB [Clostridia bacterium]
MKAEGRNAVIEAIRSDVTIDKLLVAKDLQDIGAKRILAMAHEKRIKTQTVERKILDAESETGSHQGFIAFTTDFKYCEVEDILAAAQASGQKPLIIILDGVEDPHNLGSVLRVAECGGAHGVVIAKHRAVGVNDTVLRVSAGAAEHVRVARVTNVNDTIDFLKKNNIWVMAADLNGADIYKTDLNCPLALVVGGEGAGVKRLTREKCDGVVTLPIYGKVNSLNASVACGIALYEALRQRAATYRA